MPGQITLTITQGNLKGQTFEYSERTTCLIGRSPECNIQLPSDEAHSTISRYHCLLDINPPSIRIRDFGSKNGTFVNNRIIGQRLAHQTAEEGAKMEFPEYDLKPNDEIKLGNTIFQVIIEEPIYSETTPPTSFYYQSTISGNPQPGLIISTRPDLPDLPQIEGYTIVQEIGAGGFGKVYLALNKENGESLAIKTMKSEHSQNQQSVEMFKREIENTKILKHPNIVQLRDDGYHNETFFFALEYCEEGTVVDLMKRREGTLTIDEAMPIIFEVLDALNYAHNVEIPYVKLADGTIGQGQGLVHRDLKPSNIFLSKINDKLVPKVADYGLAKAFDLAGLSGQTRSGQKAGTPVFMPRQQIIDFKYAKPEVDIWAAAASLYNMLTGAYPRNFTQKQDPFLVILKETPIPISQRNNSIPKSLAEVIDLALIDKPSLHFKTALELKTALENI